MTWIAEMLSCRCSGVILIVLGPVNTDGVRPGQEQRDDALLEERPQGPEGRGTVDLDEMSRHR